MHVARAPHGLAAAPRVTPSRFFTHHITCSVRRSVPLAAIAARSRHIEVRP